MSARNRFFVNSNMFGENLIRIALLSLLSYVRLDSKEEIEGDGVAHMWEGMEKDSSGLREERWKEISFFFCGDCIGILATPFNLLDIGWLVTTTAHFLLVPVFFSWLILLEICLENPLKLITSHPFLRDRQLLWDLRFPRDRLLARDRCIRQLHRFSRDHLLLRFPLDLLFPQDRRIRQLHRFPRDVYFFGIFHFPGIVHFLGNVGFINFLGIIGIVDTH